MEVKELRIGNLVKGTDGNEICRVEEIQKDGIAFSTEDEASWAEIDYFEGVPLTEGWLVKFGFIQDIGVMCWRNKIDTEILIVHETLAGSFRLYPRTNKIKYVHQLQNLFHALTGNELICTVPK